MGFVRMFIERINHRLANEIESKRPKSIASNNNSRNSSSVKGKIFPTANYL
jgi:hypothetical protein